MTLTFPTLAEQALAEFRNATKTTSLATIGKRMGADVETKWSGGALVTTYTFEDDTSLRVTGRGAAHRVEALLP